MKYSELIKLIKKHGCVLLHEGKKHSIWLNPATNEQFTVPRHLSQEVPAGTLRNIEKSAGIIK